MLLPTQYRIGELLTLLNRPMARRETRDDATEIVTFYATLTRFDSLRCLVTFSDIYTPGRAPFLESGWHPMNGPIIDEDHARVGEIVRVVATKSRIGPVTVERIESARWDEIHYLASLLYRACRSV